MQDKPRHSVESGHEMGRTQSQTFSNASDGDDSLPDDALATAFVDSEHQQNTRAETSTVSGVAVPAGTESLMHTPVPVIVNGQTQAHVVLASRQHIPDDATVVPAQYISPFAAPGLQVRTASTASSHGIAS